MLIKDNDDKYKGIFLYESKSMEDDILKIFLKNDRKNSYCPKYINKQ